MVYLEVHVQNNTSTKVLNHPILDLDIHVKTSRMKGSYHATQSNRKDSIARYLILVFCGLSKLMLFISYLSSKPSCLATSSD